MGSGGGRKVAPVAFRSKVAGGYEAELHMRKTMGELSLNSIYALICSLTSHFRGRDTGGCAGSCGERALYAGGWR